VTLPKQGKSINGDLTTSFLDSRNAWLYQVSRKLQYFTFTQPPYFSAYYIGVRGFDVLRKLLQKPTLQGRWSDGVYDVCHCTQNMLNWKNFGAENF